MARVVLASYTVRYPVGGYLSWTLQWLLGFQRLGHDVYFVEKAGGPRECYDPSRDVMGDDCSYGIAALESLFRRFGLEGRWCFVDAQGRYHGLPRRRIEGILKSTDLFLDTLGDGSWHEETADAGLRVFLDGESAYCQMRMENQLADGEEQPEYDRYYTVGLNVGSDRSTAPTANRQWGSFFDPVVLDLFTCDEHPPSHAPFTTVMSWQTHKPVEFEGHVYGQKDIEFVKFMELPKLTDSRLEIAVAGKEVPHAALLDAGWSVRDAHSVTATFDTWREYIALSKGEFTVCKNVFVETWSGWFSDRSAVYLASGRPVVMQDTGFSEHLPCGVGLFGIRTIDEAAAAIEAVEADFERHSRAAREIAHEYLATERVLPRLLTEFGIS